MLNKLCSFYNHIMTKIQTLISAYYAFCKRQDILNYVVKLLYKYKFFHANIKNINNQNIIIKSFASKLTNLYIFIGLRIISSFYYY